MEKQTVARTAALGLCCSCGVCRGICPTGAIGWERREGMYLPHIDEAKCISCGLCARICPGLGMAFDPAPTVEDCQRGRVLEVWNAWSRDGEKRHLGGSGGVVSTLIPALLERGDYDGAFCVDSYDYREQLHTRLDVDWSRVPKSRYLPVSQEEAAAYIRREPKARLILVGTPCALRALEGVIEQFRRDRENYLLIGLFCDQVFTYNLLDYYRTEAFTGGRTLTELHFKNKESGGWPGNLKFHFSDGSTCYHDKAHRADLKEYFMPERCLYCIDKLNVRADIALGDNYTGVDESPLGSNSVIVRTPRGAAAWASAAHLLQTRPITMEDISRAQSLSWRANNAQFALVKERKTGIPLNRGIPLVENPYMTAQWKTRMARLNAGRVYPEQPRELDRQRKLAKKVPLAQRVRGKLGSICQKLLG